jgi:glycosyltransferase involved in cell wall biosynthesis
MQQANQPLISIVVPTRNRVSLLRKSLQSAEAQTWRRKELIVVDDASTDTTPDDISRLFPQAKLVRQPAAQGPSAARNAGVAASAGDAVLFLDDDDLLHPQHLESLVAAAQSLPDKTIVSGRWRRLDPLGTDPRFGPVMCCPRERDDVATLIEFLDPRGEGTICVLSALWPRRLFETVAFDETLFTNGDVDFFGRAVLAGYAFAGRPAGMAYYRSHAGAQVAGTPSERGLVSSTRYRLKWSELLLPHPQAEGFREVVQVGLMTLIIGWAQFDRASAWLPKLENAYRQWGGDSFFVPLPPRGRLKRLAANLAMRVGGPATLGLLLDLGSRLKRGSAAPGGEWMQDADDARVVAPLL